jgi:mRNA-degrading endonuclease RelE of RelBE toxin-antitoxin system
MSTASNSKSPRYRVLGSESLRKDLDKLSPFLRERIIRELHKFGETGRGDIEKVEGAEGIWKLRVGDYRVFFYQEADEVRAMRVLHRSVAYRLDIIESLIKRAQREKRTA